MKELSIEEKARAYDEAIERAEKWRNAPNVDKIPTFGNRVIEEIFPELKESEDEKIRKGLIDYFNDFSLPTFGGLDPKTILAWLERQEKQGEQNTTKDYSTLEITDIVRQALQECESFSNIRADVYAARVGATVEKLIKKQGEQKLAWSEEDEKMFDKIIGVISQCYFGRKPEVTMDDIDWLKSLRPQNKWKPTEEQLESLRRAAFEPTKNWSEKLQSLYADLKKL